MIFSSLIWLHHLLSSSRRIIERDRSQSGFLHIPFYQIPSLFLSISLSPLSSRRLSTLGLLKTVFLLFLPPLERVLERKKRKRVSSNASFALSDVINNTKRITSLLTFPINEYAASTHRPISTTSPCHHLCCLPLGFLDNY